MLGTVKCAALAEWVSESGFSISRSCVRARVKVIKFLNFIFNFVLRKKNPIGLREVSGCVTNLMSVLVPSGPTHSSNSCNTQIDKFETEGGRRKEEEGRDHHELNKS